jgi:leucyl aminopeptidase (aminopeptidase T)
MRIRDGHVIRITGDEEAVKIRNILKPFGSQSRNVAELGIGTNPDAQLTGCTLEDEKKLGTVHIGFGNNISFGGKISVNCHYDSVILNPTLVIDTKTIIKDGNLLV